MKAKQISLGLIFSAVVLITTHAAETAKVFASPEEAASALGAAAAASDRAKLREIFGPGGEEIENPDAVAAENDLTIFAMSFNESNRILKKPDGSATIEVGLGRWPFAIPIIQTNGGWSFDALAGKEELLNRRVGRNELAVLSTMRAYVDAQREYASADRDADGILEFAQNIISADNQKDGLYWSPDLDGSRSPLGPFFAVAYAEGYSAGSKVKSEPKPFHGYFFKILKGQGANALGGKYDYVVNGNMIAGFALIAWPAEYGNSGVMTFIVNQQGRVYESNLGPKTASKAAAITKFDPDKMWSVSIN